MFRIIATLEVPEAKLAAKWGEEQFRAYNSAHYHQPSDEMRDTWHFRALIQSAKIGLAIGGMISDAQGKPRFNPDDEFAKKPATR